MIVECLIRVTLLSFLLVFFIIEAVEKRFFGKFF